MRIRAHKSSDHCFVAKIRGNKGRLPAVIEASAAAGAAGNNPAALVALISFARHAARRCDQGERLFTLTLWLHMRESMIYLLTHANVQQSLWAALMRETRWLKLLINPFKSRGSRERGEGNAICLRLWMRGCLMTRASVFFTLRPLCETR